jgi:hypothetical protein
MNSDSQQYYAAATSLARDGSLSLPIAFSQYQQFDAAGSLIVSHPFVLWPPGYPMALAAVSQAFGVPVSSAAAAVNVFALIVTLATLGWLMARQIDPSSAAAATTLVGVLPPVQRVFRVALSEPLFIALCAVTIAGLAWWLEDPVRKTRGAWVAALSAGTAINVRYLGVTLVLLQALCLARAWPRLPTRARASGALSVAAATLLGATFLVHRYVAWGCLFCEPRLPSTQGLARNVLDLFTAALKSLPAAYDVVSGPLDAAVSLIALGTVILLQRRRIPEKTRHAAPAAEVALVFVALYLVVLVALRTIIEFNSLDPRLIAPAAFSIVAIALGVALRRIDRGGQRVIVAFGVVMFVMTSQISAGRVPWRGLSDPAARRWPIVEYALQHVARQPSVPLFTPDATFVQRYAGIDAAVYFLPPDNRSDVRIDAPATVAIRPTQTAESGRRIRQIDAIGTRIIDAPSLIVWKVGARRSR